MTDRERYEEMTKNLRDLEVRARLGGELLMMAMAAGLPAPSSADAGEGGDEPEDDELGMIVWKTSRSFLDVFYVFVGSDGVFQYSGTKGGADVVDVKDARIGDVLEALKKWFAWLPANRAN